jgi:hypothetical protein
LVIVAWDRVLSFNRRKRKRKRRKNKNGGGETDGEVV